MSHYEFILDCSITMAWCFEDETSEYSEKILDALSENTAWVPALWSIEVANSLIVAERKKRISHIKAIAFKQHIDTFAIKIDDYLLTKPIELLLDLAKETGLTAYDATYLELAIRKNLPIATLDVELKKSSQKMGLSLY
ncbi:MAG: hypothetical protein A3F42_07310 [Gammaproteobacteria bacterium RIFCSPHIGHO2_12_FULL_37_34]|nr:MAG: hypothetical protein A3F42_07310 [Gammaproteobacteria bacterium RIFCSPHIGHO2_12_FULL_37_34]